MPSYFERTLNNKINYEEIRAIADSKSLSFRFSDKQTLKRHEPEGNISKKLYVKSIKLHFEIYKI